MHDYGYEIGTRNLVLALYVLTGVLTEGELKKLIENDEPIPTEWEEVVRLIKMIQRSR